MTYSYHAFDLLVPIGKLAALQKPGTAFVAKNKGDYMLIHYEPAGEISNVQTFEERIRQAAGRLAESYPTSKMMGGTFKEWKKVGSVEYRKNLGWVISEITDEESLYNWDPGPHFAGGNPDIYTQAKEKAAIKNLKSGRFERS